MVWMRVKAWMRQDNDLRFDALDQLTQIGQQIVPGRQTINVTAQGKRIEPAEISGIAKLCLAGRYGLGGCSLHGGQLQAEVPQLYTALLRYTSPQRHTDTVPGTQ